MSNATKIAMGGAALGLAAIIYIAYNVGISNILSLLASASIIFIICYLVTSILIASVLTFKWKVILHSRGIDIPYFRLFAYRLVGYSVSYLTPTAHVGGEPVRAMLLKREGVNTTTAFSTVIIDKTIEIMADIIFFSLGALLIINSVAVEKNTKIFVLCFSGALLMAMALFIRGLLSKKSMFVRIFRFLRLNKFKKLKPAEKNLAQIEREIEDFYRKDKEHFLIIVVLMLFIWGLMFLEYRFALLIFGQIASPAAIFLILTGVGIAYSLPVPAAMGTLELGQLSAAKVLNLSGATGVTLAFLVRTRDLIWTGIGIIILSFYQFSFKKLTKESETMDKEFIEKESFLDRNSNAKKRPVHKKDKR